MLRDESIFSLEDIVFSKLGVLLAGVHFASLCEPCTAYHKLFNMSISKSRLDGNMIKVSTANEAAEILGAIRSLFEEISWILRKSVFPIIQQDI